MVARRIGRSLHRIPGRETITVLHTGRNARWVKELDLKTRKLTAPVRALDTPDGDYTWTHRAPDRAILMSDGKHLMRWQNEPHGCGPRRPTRTAAADLGVLGLAGVTRMAVSPEGRWLALVLPDR